jgi:hypothetical protein
MSRNKLIIHALEREVTAGADWPAGFFDTLATADAELVSAVDDMSKAIGAGRKSKGPTKL